MFEMDNLIGMPLKVCVLVSTRSYCLCFIFSYVLVMMINDDVFEMDKLLVMSFKVGVLVCAVVVSIHLWPSICRITNSPLKASRPESTSCYY